MSPPAGRYAFSPRPHERFVGEILHQRRGGCDTDHDLYFDAAARAYFVVSTESRRGGPVHGNRHTRSTVAAFSAAHPRRAALVAELLRDSVGL